MQERAPNKLGLANRLLCERQQVSLERGMIVQDSNALSFFFGLSCEEWPQPRYERMR